MHEPTQPSPPTPAARRLRLGFRRFSAVELLIALVLLFVSSPLLEGLPGGELIEVFLMTAVMVAAVLAVGGRKRMLLITALLALPAILAKWGNHARPGLVSPAVFLVAALVFLSFIIVSLLRFVLRTSRVNGEVLCASISAYLLLGLVWALAYRLVAYITPEAFIITTGHRVDQPMHGFVAFYFSFVTLSTVGYGDIVPVAPMARMLAVMEAMTGLLYISVLVARLVALYSVPVSTESPREP